MYGVLKYIHENIKENLTLADVAAKFGYSKWHFCSKFKEYTGKSFVKYVRHFRLQLASLEILSGKKITDIVTCYGYDSPSGFNKAFFSEFGCYPSEYKKNTKDALIYYERRKITMFQLNDRCEMLRRIVMSDNEYEELFCAQHKVYTTLGQAEAAEAGLDNPMIMARGMERVLEDFRPNIIPGELVVGFNFPDAKYGENIKLEDDESSRCIMRANGISDEDIEKFFSVKNPAIKHLSIEITDVERDSEREWAAQGYCMHSNHSVIGYERVLKLGFEGLLREVEETEAAKGTNQLYSAMKTICRSACKMGEKYAEEARRIKESGDPAYQIEDLDRIISVCSRVPAKPASNFHEAIQALWFAHIINTWEDRINANSLGRLDQILYPYYKADIESGAITKDEAFELVCCLWLKLYRRYDVQQSCVGGTDVDGNCVANELSFMMLDATEQLDFVRCLSVRYSQKSDREFLRRALEVVGHVQKGVPFFFNDDVMIPALEAKGISHADACDYTQIGCVETVIPGKSNPHAVTGRTNLLKALEYVFCNGYSMMHPEMKNGCETGELEELDTYEKFYDAVLRQIHTLIETSCRGTYKRSAPTAIQHPRPYKSLLTEGCLESGRDFNDKGATYDYYQVMLGGIPNLADSLEVIRQFVYKEHKYTLGELKEMLLANFPDEAVRCEFVNRAAKFGNDIDSVDSIAVDIVTHACDYLDEFSEKFGLSYHAQPFTFLWMIDQGRECAASPDGRRSGEIIAYSVSPMQGRDFNGLTALFNSIAKFPTKRTPGTTSAIVEIDPKLFTDRNISTLVDILLAASAKGLCNVQFNTIDAEMLVDAKKHPEKYNNLAVRVSGFSQKFNLLRPELQDHIIARTKHACL